MFGHGFARPRSRHLPFARLCGLAAHASTTCPDQQTTPQVPKDPALCKQLYAALQNPGGMPLNEYEDKLGQFLGAFCHRNEAAGWKVDKRVRDTGPGSALTRTANGPANISARMRQCWSGIRRISTNG